MHRLLLLADQNEEINKWLGENPLVLGLIFFVLGLGIGGWGLYELMSGVAYDKKGRQMTGGSAKAMAIVRIVAGAVCLLFGLYKMIF